jgi:hypothetical protein
MAVFDDVSDRKLQLFRTRSNGSTACRGHEGRGQTVEIEKNEPLKEACRHFSGLRLHAPQAPDGHARPGRAAGVNAGRRRWKKRVRRPLKASAAARRFSRKPTGGDRPERDQSAKGRKSCTISHVIYVVGRCPRLQSGPERGVVGRTR